MKIGWSMKQYRRAPLSEDVGALRALACPNCGRQPRLRESFKYAQDAPATTYSCHIFKFECRRWLGLKLCFGPQRENWIEKGWGDVGRRVATEKWNSAVENIMRAEVQR